MNKNILPLQKNIMKKLIKRIDFRILSTILAAVVAFTSSVYYTPSNIWLALLSRTVAIVLPILVVNLLIYFAEYRRTSHNNAPPYLEWFFKTRHLPFKIISFVVLLIPNFIMHYIPTIDSLGGKIAILITLYGFCFGILYQPYTIYVKLIKLDWFNNNDYRVD